MNQTDQRSKKLKEEDTSGGKLGVRPKDDNTSTAAEHSGSVDEKHDQPLIPHTTTTASNVIEDIVETVETVANWIGEKVGEIKKNDGVGPYSSPGTCAPSDLDPIATGILPAMPKPTEKNVAIDKSHQDETRPPKDTE